MSEFEIRPITAEDYLRARDLMMSERSLVWMAHEDMNFENDKFAELVEAYDLVIDSLTCLAMEVDKGGKK